MASLTAAAVVAVLAATAVVALALRWVPAVPVPVVHEADLARDFTPSERARERDFRRRVRPWGLVSMAVGILVPTALVVSGLVTALVDTVGWPWWGGVVVAVSLVVVATRLATLPIAVVVRRESLRVGLAAGTWGRWVRDLVVGAALGWLLMSVAFVGWVAAVRWWPDSWWAVVAAVAAALVVLLSFLLPVIVEPIFARFQAMPDGPLRTGLLELAASDGVRVGDVLVADASRRTTALNAYVSGLGSTRRIVVHDTLLDRGRDDEVRAVVAHELGHVVTHDVRTGTVLGSLVAVAGVAAAAVVLGWQPLLDLARVSGPGDPAVAALLVVLASWAELVAAPAQSAVSRRIERRADQHCLELTRDAVAVASMHRSLAVTNLAPLEPVRILHWWFGTHPTSPERIATAREWARRHGATEPPALAPSD